MEKVKVRLRPLVSKLNLPTVIKTAVLPGDSVERIFIATQVGEIFYIGNGEIRTFLDIRSSIIELGAKGGYDERGLLGLAFHPEFYYNGLFYLHYSVAGSQGPGALADPFQPNPCDPSTLNLKWENRETQYDHIDTVEEWVLHPNGRPERRRALLNLRRPFANHNGVNSLTFSPETGRLVLTTGDGGSGFDPYNLAQDDMDIAGKIIEIAVNRNVSIVNPPIVTRFNELPQVIQETLTVIVKGVRNIPGISYQRINNQYRKYVGNVGQDLVESIFSFVNYKPIPVTRILQASSGSSELDQEGLINLGWRGWEGAFPTPIIRDCTNNPDLNEKTIAYYQEAVALSATRLQPLTSYFHQDSRPNKFAGTALTGVQAYMGNAIPGLNGSVVFTDGAKKETQPQVRGALAHVSFRPDGQHNDFSEIQIDYDFGSESAYFVSLGSNRNQSRLYLGVYGSINVTDFNQGTLYEIVP
ncbi:PQQ-dependent sugar dehydrogenase [Ornithinibacillus californiensis]|uniref:PQQ-dependent sugar dehydrogenase n=1 Tax=Ornithinibacillus californiensis TaxID=161536 RepID=UPI00064DA569|nr:PQQ-dependent sugar dehydrogenase [Ornithinibacillus californiensis]